MQVQSLGQENTLEEEMKTHCTVLAWRIPWRNLTGLPSRTQLSNWVHTHTHCSIVRIHWDYPCMGFCGGSVIKNPPAVQEMLVRSLGWGDSLEKEMATHSSILAWEIPRTEEPSGLQPMGSQRAEHDWVTNTSTSSLFFYCLNALIDSQFMLEFSY